MVFVVLCFSHAVYDLEADTYLGPITTLRVYTNWSYYGPFSAADIFQFTVVSGIKLTL